MSTSEQEKKLESLVQTRTAFLTEVKQECNLDDEEYNDLDVIGDEILSGDIMYKTKMEKVAFMNDFVILSDFPQDAKAIGPAFDGKVYYSFKKESYFTFNDLLDDDDLREGININQDSDRDCTIGIPLFVVSMINDEGKLIKFDENTFFQSVLNGNSGLEKYIMIDPQSIIEKLSTLKELSKKELRRSANAYDCDALWPTHILYSFDEDSKTIGYEISGSGYVINNAPNFEKNPELTKLS